MAYTTINKSSSFMNTKLYTGNGSSNAITGVGFQPDWTWIKVRNAAHNHYVYDAVRGVENKMSTNTNAGEVDMGTAGLNTFGADGFTVGNDTDENNNGDTYVSWNWKANGAGSANTDGSINSTASVNTTAGFSIATFTTLNATISTVGHGLGVVPDVVIVKTRANSNGWFVYHKDIGNDHFLRLETTGAKSDNEMWNDTTPTSSVFSINANNLGASTSVAYCFAEKAGYSKFGSYTGNGNATPGTFIYTGFKPKFVIIKVTSETDSWFMHDDKRDGYNDDNEYLFPDLNTAEGTNVNRIRLLSNGFQLPTTDKSHNKSGASYIYIAFGQTMVGTNNVPCTAN